MGTATACESIVFGNDKTIRSCHPLLPHNITELQNEFNDVFQSSWVTNFAKYTEQLKSQLIDIEQIKYNAQARRKNEKKSKH